MKETRKRSATVTIRHTSAYVSIRQHTTSSLRLDIPTLSLSLSLWMGIATPSYIERGAESCHSDRRGARATVLKEQKRNKREEQFFLLKMTSILWSFKRNRQSQHAIKNAQDVPGLSRTAARMSQLPDHHSVQRCISCPYLP
jgi:hypothetical protein